MSEIALLKSLPLFQFMDEAELAQIQGLLTGVGLAPSQVLFREGESGGTLYIIRSGRVELSVLDHTGNPRVVDILDPGEFFGEISLLDGGKRSAQATALGDVQLFCLAREPFLAMLRERPDAALDVMAALARRMRKTDELIREGIPNANEVFKDQTTFGDRVSDAVARFGGSWSFILVCAVVMGIWVLINTILVFYRPGQPFDPYPFILLNLVLSMIAAIQAPVIMMSQNRQDAKDRIRGELDFQVNVKAELGVRKLQEQLDELERRLFEKTSDPR